mmetsp:Transcript_36599/g.122546  ORF Transcript_36599/g.122546 Transcript_36599/m.122546 type:complete len:344 (-) Transcript_36599:1216-2247(-)
MAPVGERLAAAVARAIEGHDCTVELMSIWSGFTRLEEGKRRPNQELQAVLEKELTFVRVQELAAPGRLTASRCMVLELGATFVDLVAVTLVSDMRSSRAITSLSEQIVAESDHSSRCSALSAALRSLGREGRPRRGLPTFVDAILKMLAGRSLIPAGLAALSNVCGLKLAAAEAEPLRGSAAELAAAFIGALATEPQLALKGFALMLKAGPAVTLREAALLHEAPLLAALPALPEARRSEGLAVLAILADPRANSPLPSGCFVCRTCYAVGASAPLRRRSRRASCWCSATRSALGGTSRGRQSVRCCTSWASCATCGPRLLRARGSFCCRRPSSARLATVTPT